MTATLADVNKSLIEVAENTEKTSKGIDAFLENLEAAKRKELEAERERMAAASSEPSRAAAKSGGKSSSGGGFSFPQLGLGKLLTVGGLTAAAVTLGKGLLKRGIPGIALATLSDSIADYFIKGEGKDELRKQFSGALAGGGIGFTLFGKKGLAIGSLLGFLTKDKKVDEELGKLVDNLETLGKAIFGEFSFSGIAKKITEKAGSGLESLNNLISGDSFSDKNISGVVDDIQGAAGVLGVFAFFVSSKFRKALLSIRGLKKLAIFSGLLAIAKTLGYGLTPDKDGVPTSERPDMLDYGLAGGTLAYGAVKTAQAFRGGPQMARPIQKNYSEKFDEVRKMSKSQLKKVGIEKDGKSLTKSGGKIVGEADLDKALVNKYGKIFGPKGIARFAGGIFPLGALATLMTVGMVPSILADETKTEDQKKKEVGEVLGESFNMATFGVLGSMLGGITFGPKGAAIGGTALGLLGMVAPNVAGEFLASFFFNRPMSESMKNKITSIGNIRKAAQGGVSDALGGFQDISSTAGLMSRLPSTSASNIGTNINPAYSYPMFDNPGGAGGGMSLAVANNNNNQAAIFNDGPAIDVRDQLAGGFNY